MPLISIVCPLIAISAKSHSVERQHTGTGRTVSGVISLRGCIAAVIAHGLLQSANSPAVAAPCWFEPQGEGRVAAVIDAKTFRLEDGREIRLAGIEPASPDRARGAAALAAILAGRDVTLHGQDDAPDRYGRQPAFVFVEGADTPVQGELLSRGEALAAANVADKDCARLLADAEAGARQA